MVGCHKENALCGCWQPAIARPGAPQNVAALCAAATTSGRNVLDNAGLQTQDLHQAVHLFCSIGCLNSLYQPASLQSQRSQTCRCLLSHTAPDLPLSDSGQSHTVVHRPSCTKAASQLVKFKLQQKQLALHEKPCVDIFLCRSGHRTEMGEGNRNAWLHPPSPCPDCLSALRGASFLLAF